MADDDIRKPQDRENLGELPEIAEGLGDVTEPEPLQDPYAFDQTAPEPVQGLPEPPEPEGVDESPVPPLPPEPSLEDVEPPPAPEQVVPPDLDLTATASGDQNMPFDDNRLAQMPPPPMDDMGGMGGQEVVELLRSIDGHLEKMEGQNNVGVFGA